MKEVFHSPSQTSPTPPPTEPTRIIVDLKPEDEMEINYDLEVLKQLIR